jgi:DNA primase
VKPESAAEFGLGYAPSAPSLLSNLLKKEGFRPEEMGQSGLAVRRDDGSLTDRFRKRWIFPIESENGRVIAFGGRALGDDQPKYVNSPETPLYSKSRTLYNLSRAREAIRKAGRAVIVEGYMDAIAVYQAGVTNVVASCGTALTSAQARMLAKYTPDVVVNYDPDSAGVAAMDRSVMLLLEEGLAVKILRLAGGLDPDLFVKQNGAPAYQKALEGAQPFFQYLAGRALEVHGKVTPEAKLAALNFVLPYLSRVPNALIRSELVADISQKMSIDSAIVRDAFQKAGMAQQATVRELVTGTAKIPPAEAMLIRLLLEDEGSRPEISSLLEHRDLAEEMECGGIIAGLLGMMAAGVEVDVAGLADRLDDSQQRVLAELAFNKESRPVSSSEIDSYIQALERKRLARQRGELKGRILDAQKAGNSKRVVELLQEQQELDRKLAQLV